MIFVDKSEGKEGGNLPFRALRRTKNAFVEARANGFLVSFSMEERFEERVEEYTHTYATIICHHRYYNTQTFYRATSSFNLFF